MSDPPLDAVLLMQPRGARVGVECDFGSGRFRSLATEDDLYLAPANAGTHIVVDQPHGVRTLALPGKLLRVLLPGAPADFGALHAGAFQSRTVGMLVDGLWREAGNGDGLASLAVDGALAVLVVELLRLAAPACLPRTGGLAAWQLKRVCEAMEAHLGGDIGLEALAGIAGCSPTHFSRAFKQSMGMPPFDWLLRRRTERAKELLADPGLPLAEVALAVGFAAQPQFTTAFRRVTGTTPGAWRRERLR